MSHILVVEDSKSIRLLLVRRLELAGHEVDTAADGVLAIDRLRSDRPGSNPDLILLDATMPHLDGAATLTAIRRLKPEVPVLLVTAQPDLAENGYTGVDGVVPKPIEFDRLLGLIADLT